MNIRITYKLFHLLVAALLLLASCKADIQKMYNENDSLELEFEACVPKDQSFLYEPIKDSKCSFWYSKKKLRAVLSLHDAGRRSVSANGVEYNSNKSDQNQLCLQNDNYRFVLANSDTKYILYLYAWQYHDWQLLAVFTQDEDDNVIPAVDIKDVLRGDNATNVEEESTNGAELDEQGGLQYKVVRGNSFDGFVSIRAEKSSRSRELGKLHNDEEATYLATEGEWYKIEMNGTIGYVYSKYAGVATMVDP